MRASSPSIPTTAWGVFASRTYRERERVRERVRVVQQAHIVVIAMRAVLVALLICGHVLAEGLLALLTDEGHVRGPRKRMRLCLRVTFGTVEPLLAARGTDGDLRV